MKILNLLTTTRIHTSKVRLLCSTLILLSFSTYSQKEELSFLFVGDVMQHDGQINAAHNKSSDTYEYDDSFKFVKPIINEYDIRIANLEVTLAGEPYKGYPRFSAPDELAEATIRAGFNVILTSNNHSCDRGAKGIERTLDVLDDLGVMHTGTFRNQAERDSLYPLMLEEKGMRIAILNYTYGTNGNPTPAPLIVNYIDSVLIKKDIARAKELNADYIICNMHWGKEYKPLPNKYQKTYEAVCYRAGADMVIGGHPHVVQPIEKKVVYGKEKLTVWSLGNFVSNMQTRYTRGGVMVGATISKQEETISLGEVNYHFVYVHKKSEGAITNYYVLPDYDYNMYRPGFLSSDAKQKMALFLADSRKLYKDNNRGNSEGSVYSMSRVEKIIQHQLVGYYSVLIESDNYDLLNDASIGKYLHSTVAKDGKCCILSGVYPTLEELRGQKKFIEYCLAGKQVSIAYVTPEGVVKMAE